MIKRLSIATAVAIIILVTAGEKACAGISPENVIVVVNADSHASRTIANHYIQARDIPSGNVILLRDVPDGLQVSLADFKSKILTPILDTLNARGIAAQTRVIAYSADFPTAVNVAEHRKKLVHPNVKKLQAGVASITGVTFFYRFMLADQPEYLHFGSNMYARGKFDRHFVNPFNGDDREKFAAAAKDLAEERYETAAEAFAELFQRFPSLSPLALRAAEASAKSGDKQKAIELIKAAIREGWWSAEYLKQNETLAELLDDPVLAKTLRLLSSAPIAVQGPVGFANHRGYTASGHAVSIDQGGIPYLLSCSLAVVHENGSTVEQAIAVLERAAKADRTFPSGDFRFAANEDVRAKTRFPNVADALIYLQESGHKTEVFRSNLPTTAGDVTGLMVGRATVDLKNRKWRLVPGAIAENLTSFGGAYNTSGHTKITEFLHAGAAMSSGTVAEPYALQFKFPLPMMYGYYADGVSAIEAFYLSVSSPYQLLIVGDPICQPFARAPDAWVDIRLSDEKKNRVVFSMQSIGLNQPKTQTRAIELYVGGRMIKRTPPATAINFDLPEQASGVIDLRAALIGLDVTEPRISFSAQLDLKGPLPTPRVTVMQNRQADSAEMKFKLQCDEADSIELMHLNEDIGTINGAAGELTIDTKPLGSGPLRFRARAHFTDRSVLGMPIVDQAE